MFIKFFTEKKYGDKMENMINSRISKIGNDKLLSFNCFDMLFLIVIAWALLS